MSHLCILASLVIPALAPCSLAALAFPLSFLAAFSLARSLWLPLVMAKSVSSKATLKEETIQSKIGPLDYSLWRFGLYEEKQDSIVVLISSKRRWHFSRRNTNCLMIKRFGMGFVSSYSFGGKRRDAIDILRKSTMILCTKLN